MQCKSWHRLLSFMPFSPNTVRPRFPAIYRAIGGSTLTSWNASHPCRSCCPSSESRANPSPDLPSGIQPTLCVSAQLQWCLLKCSSSDRRSELNTSPFFFRERCKGIFPFREGNSTERQFRGWWTQVLYRQDFLACGWILWHSNSKIISNTSLPHGFSSPNCLWSGYPAG